MGKTNIFYFIKNNNFTVQDILEKTKQFCEIQKNYLFDSVKVYFNENYLWLPLYSELLEGESEPTDVELYRSMERVFQTPIVVMSVFDDDFVFLLLCDKGTIDKYICADKTLVEEYGYNDYKMEVPLILCNYGISRENLMKIWKRREGGCQSDILYALAQEMQTILIEKMNEYFKEAKIIHMAY